MMSNEPQPATEQVPLETAAGPFNGVPPLTADAHCFADPVGVPATDGPQPGQDDQQQSETPPAHSVKVHASPPPLFGLQFMLTVFVFAIFVITFVVQAFQIPSESMENTLLIGDFLLVDKLHFASGPGLAAEAVPYRPIARGDIVVFHYPVDPSQYFVKRVIGMPGDRIRLRNKKVFVNDVAVEESYAVHNLNNVDAYRDNFPAQRDLTRNVNRAWRSELPKHVYSGELTVPAASYFVLGDNRDQSLDSRYWGFVPRDHVVGRPLVVYLSLKGNSSPETGSANDKLIRSGQLLAHFLDLARWDRMFRLVR